MYSPDTMLDRFAMDNLQTAGGPKIVIMCFDRLDRDLLTALIAMEQNNHFETNRLLGHAQELLGEMADMLDLEIWEHANALLSVYDYVLRRLSQANASKDPGFVLEAQRLMTEIGDAFRQAAASAPAATVAAHGNDVIDGPRLYVQA
ncbi:MAG: flagellar protein FliS [Ilumatobacter sp.]|jgi:flagellar protein FliS